MKTCRKCRKNKKENEFYKETTHKDGLSSYCKICKNERTRHWQKTNAQKWTEYVLGRKATIARKYVNWKYSAKARKIPFNVSIEYLQSLPLVCFYTGISLTLECNKTNTISLDRIDNHKGYEEGNVCFTTWIINRMKNIFTEKQCLHLCECWLTHKGYKVERPDDIFETFLDNEQQELQA